MGTLGNTLERDIIEVEKAFACARLLRITIVVSE